MRAYLDSCAIIYAIEGQPEFRRQVLKYLADVEADALSILSTSRLSMLECRVKPLQNDDNALVACYDSFFLQRRLEVHEVSAPIIALATDLRVRYQFKTPDAIHLATAIHLNADLFLTGDVALRKCTEVSVHILEAT